MACSPTESAAVRCSAGQQGSPGPFFSRPGRASADGLVALRRELHSYPEAGGQEVRTAGVVADRLRAAGLDVVTGVGGHGVVATLSGARAGRTVAYRADMDAVPPDQQINGVAGPAHFCGHDLHTTIGVGVAEALARRRRDLAGTVVFLFQPAEELLAGAAAMLAAGVLESTRPAEIHALHCGPWPVGKLMVMPGSGMPGEDRGVVTFTGADAMDRARRLVTRITALRTVTRPTTPAQLGRFAADLQKPHGPYERFLFISASLAAADRPEVRISSRCWPESRWPEVRETIRRLAGPGAVTFPSAEPWPALVTPHREALELRRFLGPARAGTIHGGIPFAAEDFSLFLRRLPGTYSFLGVRRPRRGAETAYPHWGTFDPDERAIGVGVRAMTSWLARRAS
ncbi:M20/M25/M40 family metallo-hydrolase [Paractinoplanes lichenicola]|uniref:M20/M25/M40 family metallo-hydrolase n=1 Tax=Paractinoplanes lichenicola TaxID=2802976 RepID=A0ABS1W4Z1_9ACTN|nr:M20/M25/M40 family metallo-hydrolase [Actinoplanes lichenicola]MBL7261618.1 M20/M25/M40 family metallo-hydrolase [Actinoplanes lichenicola]